MKKIQLSYLGGFQYGKECRKHPTAVVQTVWNKCLKDYGGLEKNGFTMDAFNWWRKGYFHGKSINKLDNLSNYQ